jgi:hypothetical protein
MLKSASIVLAGLLGVFGPADHAPAISSVSHVAVAPRPLTRPASQPELSQIAYTENRGQTRNCANFAAVRALMAKASGSDFAIQTRVLNVTFLLCMHGASQSD